MNTFRHNYDLRLGNDLALVIAPRYFVINNRIYYVHICDFDCTCVEVFGMLRSLENGDKVQVYYNNCVNLHCNSKGLYFNFSYWVDNHKKKTTRIYICD